MKDLRKSLFLKVIATALVCVCATGAALGLLGSLALEEGYGCAPSYEEDRLCLETMEKAMHAALRYTIEDSGAYYGGILDSDYRGFSAAVYDGSAETGVLLGRWGEEQTDPAVIHTITVAYERTAGSSAMTHTPSPVTPTQEAAYEAAAAPEPSGFFTVVGQLASEPAKNSEFAATAILYRLLRPMTPAGTILVTLLLAAAALLLTVYLLCAAGHRRGCGGITPSWQDRIPLDLYLAIMACVFTGFLYFAVTAVDAVDSLSSSPAALLAAYLCQLGCFLTVLAAAMSLAVRLKLGKWWRNTLCRMVLDLCRRAITGLCRGTAGLFRLVSFTRRSTLVFLGILLTQAVLTCLALQGSIFPLVLIAADAVLLIAAARYVRQLQQLKAMGEALARGEPEASTDTGRMYFDLREHAENLNTIGVGMTRAVEQRLKSERLKTELITNVSHDIKTPLTSIVNYVDLLKKEELPERAEEYVAVLDRQSRRLKKLTEDLVEASKASTGNLAVHPEPILVNEIIHQATGDYGDRLAAGQLELIVNTYEGNLTAVADGRLLWRVLDNLLSNVCKYALAGTRVYIDLSGNEETVTLSVKNISREPLNAANADELMERFVRGDASRHTEGSGLGLNIARSLTELMGGSFALSVDGDLFKATVTLKAVK